MHLAISTIAHHNTLARTVIWIFVRPGALATFQNHGIVAHIHKATTDKHILTCIQVNGIARRCALLGINRCHIVSRGKDIAPQIANTLTLIQMIRPERRVNDAHILYCNILRMRDIHISWTHSLQICAVLIELSTNPEFLPISLTITINGAWTCNSEAIAPIGIDQSRKIVQGLTLHTCFHQFEIAYAVTASQLAIFLNLQMRSWLKKKRTTNHKATRNDNHAAAFLCTTVNNGLQLLCLYLL